MTDLKHLAPVVLRLRAQQRHWQALPDAIARALRNVAPLDHDDAGQVTQRLLPLQSEAWQHQPQLQVLSHWLQEFMPRLHRGGSIERELADCLHASLEQHLYVAARDYREDLPLLGGILDLPLSDQGEACFGTLSELSASLSARLPALQPISLAPTELRPHQKAFHVLIVENEPLWQHFVQDVLGLLRSRLGRDTQLSATVLPELAAAQAWLADYDQAPFAGQVLAVVDLGLPGPDGGASRENGIRLIAEDLRSYSRNFPVIVLTTPPHLLYDQLRLSNLGVAASDYILKSSEQDPAQLLLSALERLIRRSLSHVIALPEDSGAITLDGHPLNLPPQARAVFEALAQLSENSAGWFSPYDILDRIDFPEAQQGDPWLLLAKERHGDWGQDFLLPISNVMRFWHARKQDHGGDPQAAIQAFRQMQPTLWNNSRALLQLWLQAQGRNETPGLADFEQAFGQAAIQSQRKPKLVYDAVFEIRKRIHQAYNQAGRYIDASRELLAQNPNGSGYRLLGQITSRREARPAQRFKVLALENNRERQSQYLAIFEHLPHLNLSLAGSVEAAVACAREAHFDILLLDLHVPLSQADWEADPDKGVFDGGVQALAQIQALIPGIRVLIPTLWSARDELRQQLAGLGVQPGNYIPLQPENPSLWEGHLVLNLNRLCQEIEGDLYLPPLPAWRCPRIIIRRIKGSLVELEVNGGKSVFRSKQGQLMQALLATPGEVVSETRLLKLVYCDAPPTQGLTQLLKRIYAEIRDNWLADRDDFGDEDPALEILERVENPKRGLILHGHVIQAEPGS